MVCYELEKPDEPYGRRKKQDKEQQQEGVVHLFFIRPEAGIVLYNEPFRSVGGYIYVEIVVVLGIGAVPFVQCYTIILLFKAVIIDKYIVKLLLNYSSLLFIALTHFFTELFVRSDLSEKVCPYRYCALLLPYPCGNCYGQRL